MILLEYGVKRNMLRILSHFLLLQKEMKNYLSIYNFELKLLKKLYEYLYQQLFNIKIFLFSPI